MGRFKKDGKKKMNAFYEYERDRALIGIHMAAVNHQQGVNGKVAGNLAAMAQIKDAIIILHGPKGCAYHYRYFARPILMAQAAFSRSFTSQSPPFRSSSR